MQLRAGAGQVSLSDLDGLRADTEAGLNWPAQQWKVLHNMSTMTKHKRQVGIVSILSLAAGVTIVSSPIGSASGPGLAGDLVVRPLAEPAPTNSLMERWLVAKEVSSREGREITASDVRVVGPGTAHVDLAGRAIDVRYGYRWKDCPADTSDDEFQQCVKTIVDNPTGFFVLGYSVQAPAEVVAKV